MHKIRFLPQTPLKELTALSQILQTYLRGLLLRGGRGKMVDTDGHRTGREGKGR